MVKGSLGSRMGPLVEAMRQQIPAGPEGVLMLFYLLTSFADEVSVFNVFRTRRRGPVRRS